MKRHKKFDHYSIKKILSRRNH